jgi:import inner membrane translocase subunit TIM23
MLAEKMASLIGPSYAMAFFVGAAMGLTKIPPPKARRTTRLLVNNYLNNIGKTSARFGNNVGGAIFMYLLVGKSLNFVFQEELESFSEMGRSAIFGAVTGAIYKSTRGLRPMIFASVLGAGCGSLYTYAWSKGYLQLRIK